MRHDQPKTIRLQDYTPPPFGIESVDLHFDLREDLTRVRSRLSLRRRDPAATDLRLHGEQLKLLSIAMNGRPLGPHAYAADAEGLTLNAVPDAFELEVITELQPHKNTALEGLYRSSGLFCTQCEAEGFRRITYYLDRPDVLAPFTTTIEADQDRYPLLLSNGNPVDQGRGDDGRHWVRWEDPFPKPSYLFALVAGDLDWLEEPFTTASGRAVTLRLYAHSRHVQQCRHAMASLKRAMRWDEETYGLEYDLDIYMIVAVDDFNMGAMENKGLNIFNAKYVLARPETATDDDYDAIENVVGHEYFHNWTGNRVTCRDWFQLSLKEGLTVFRDQQFSASCGSAALQRIRDVRTLRSIQFPEDAGPMAHPVRPDAYVEINNFYTATVYNKGAEVVRMYQTLLGADGFRRGLREYLERHDGEAATTDDFLAAMEWAGGMDLSQFGRWYQQSGTPVVEATGEHDPERGEYRLQVRQHCAPTAGQPHKQPFLIPLRIALLDAGGRCLPLKLKDLETGSPAELTLAVSEVQQTYVFEDLRQAPVPSLLRGFSAPVELKFDYSDEQLAFLARHDDDLFNRWEAAQQLSTRVLLHMVEQGAERPAPVLSELFQALLGMGENDPALLAEMLLLPGEGRLAEAMAVTDVDGIHRARQTAMTTLADAAEKDLRTLYQELHDTGPYRYEAAQVGRRKLKNLCLGYLTHASGGDHIALAFQQFRQADNMTDALWALQALQHVDAPERDAALEEFYQRWRDEALVLDKWLALQAATPVPEAVQRVRDLLRHPGYDAGNPNRVRSLLGTFAHRNLVGFHAASGDGYRLVAEQILALDPANPQVAARLAGAFSRWRRMDASRQTAMQQALEEILEADNLSSDTFEIASKILQNK